MVLSILVAFVWRSGWPIPVPIAAYLNIFAGALHPVRALRRGLDLSVEGMRRKLAASMVLTIVKLVIMPLVVYGLCMASGLNTALHYCRRRLLPPCIQRRCSSSPGSKVEEELVTATVSITTLLSVVTLLGWLYALSGLWHRFSELPRSDSLPGKSSRATRRRACR